jgi:hypothetical protein
MSLNTHCRTYKAKDGNWYLEIADRYNGREEEADTYGPFITEELVDQFLYYNFANPGGGYVHRDGKFEVPTISPSGRPVQNPDTRPWWA